MAKNKAKAGAVIIVGLTLILLMMAFVAPIGINAVNDTNSSETVNQTQGVEYSIASDLNSTATAISDTGSNATISLEHVPSGSTDSATIDEGANTTLTVDGNDVTVTVDTVHDASNATVSYTYPSSVHWGGGTIALFGLLALIGVLAVFVFVIGLGLKALD